MLKKEDNDRITLVGRGTPGGDMFRRYWQPALLCEELPTRDGAPVRVRLLGEDLLAFRDSEGHVGLVDAYCPHRRAPMFFGRNEDCGIRCIYHGWKFDRHGNCTDLPTEQAGSPYQAQIKIKAYPVVEKGGICWTYMGPASDMPDPPDYEWTRAPATHRFVSKTFEDCNWLQAMEGGLDTAHSSFVHNDFIGNNRSLRNQDRAPSLVVEQTNYGYYYVSTRKLLDDTKYVRLYQFMMPNQLARSSTVNFVAGAGDKDPHKHPKMDGHLWVPIDDEQCWVYNWSCAVDQPFPPEYPEFWESFMGRGKDDLVPGTYMLRRNASNDYMIDREMQKTKTFLGIKGINTQDYALQERMDGGRRVDRSNEFLGSTDKAIVTSRRQLLEAVRKVADGERPRGADPVTYRIVRPVDRILKDDEDWRTLYPALSDSSY